LIVVVDTNVWISALVFSKPGSVPVRALKRAVRDDVLAASTEMRAEIHRILTQKFSWSEHRAALQLEAFLTGALMVRLTNTVNVCRDPKDNMFLECAALAKADFLVAGDKDLLVLGSYGSTRIITPLEYVNLEHETNPR